VKNRLTSLSLDLLGIPRNPTFQPTASNDHTFTRDTKCSSIRPRYQTRQAHLSRVVLTINCQSQKAIQNTCANFTPIHFISISVCTFITIVLKREALWDKVSLQTKTHPLSKSQEGCLDKNLTFVNFILSG